MVGLTHQTALVVIPPAESWPPIQAIRKKHDRKIRRWMPHVTLIYPFLPREQVDTARQFLADACGETPALEIQLAEFSTFRGPSLPIVRQPLWQHPGRLRVPSW